MDSLDNIDVTIEELLSKHFPVLAKMPSLRKEIADNSEVRTFPKGAVLMKEGSSIQVVPFLITGLIKVYKEDEMGNELLLYYIEHGESCIMSLTSCLRNEGSKIKAIVEEDSEILLIPSEKSVLLSQKYFYMNEYFYDLFNVKYEELLEVIGVLTYSKKDVRLMEYLKKESLHKNTHIIKATHQKIADELGSSREVISRILKKLEKEGQVRLGHSTIELLEI